MSQDIIRSTKEHEVVIPEGSINAKSKTSSVASGTIEPEHVERVTSSNTVVDRRVSVDEAQRPDSENVKLGPQFHVLAVRALGFIHRHAPIHDRVGTGHALNMLRLNGPACNRAGLAFRID